MSEPQEPQQPPAPPSDQHSARTITGKPLREELKPEVPPPADFGHYHILGEIARGGVGVVYRAKQHGLDRVVALKMLQGGNTVGAEQVQRFMLEAQAAAKLQHPNIVPIFDFGTCEGQHYFTMAYIEGESLSDKIAKGPIPAREALEIIRQVADALHYAHEHGVIHRDIKPGNILIDKDGSIKVTDFGLAKELNGEQMHLTVTGQVMGTPRYMSPEQASGYTARADARSDVFSLGVTLYEMLSGKSAFNAENIMDMLQEVCTLDPPSPDKINPKVHSDASTVCMKAIEKEPERRYQTAGEMRDDIERFLAGEPIEGKASGPVRRTVRKLKRHSKVIGINVGIAALAVYLLVFYLKTRPSWLELHITTPDFELAIDGTPIDPESLNAPVKLKAGKHHLIVASEPNYDPQEMDFVIDPAESRTLSFSLERRKGTLIVNASPADAAITIEGPRGYHAPLRGPSITQELPTGTYKVRVYRENYLLQDLRVQIQNRVTNKFEVTLSSIDLWSVPTSATLASIPAVADVDGTGVPAVVAGDDAGNIYCLVARTGVTKWVHALGSAVQAPLAVSSMMSGTPGFVFAATTGSNTLYCLSGVDGREMWKKPFAGSGVLGAILVRDINGDGMPDAIIGTSSGVIAAISGMDGAAIWATNVEGRVESAIGLTQIDNRLVVVVGTASKMLACFDARTGAPLWKIPTGSPLLFPPRFDEIDGQPVVLLPTPKSPGDLRTLTAVSLTTQKILGVSDRFPLRLDLNGDGQLEQLVATGEGTTCFAADGTNRLWQSEYVIVGAYSADLDGDGTLDLVFNNGPDGILVVSGKDGVPIGTIQLDSATGRGFALDDVDRDGYPDLVVGAGARLHCFSLQGGRKNWSVRGDGYYDSPFAVAEGRFITKNDAGEIAAYDPQSSQPLWKFKTGTQPPLHGGVVAEAGIAVDADAEARLVRAFDVATGKVLWQMKMPTAGEVIGAPNAHNGTVVVSDGVAGVYAFGLSNGVARWSVGLSNITAAAGIGGGKVVLNGPYNSMHVMYCLALADGQPLWQQRFSDAFPTAPVFVDVNGDGVEDVVALCDNGFLYALNGKDGVTLWQYQHTGARVHTGNGVRVVDTDGYIATSHGDVLCIDLKTGTPRWTYQLKEPIHGLPAVGDLDGDGVPDVVVATMKSRVHCISGTSTRVLWSYELGAPVRYCAPLLMRNSKGGAPLVVIGSGPPIKTLYVLRGDAPRVKDRGWSGPWKEVVAVK